MTDGNPLIAVITNNGEEIKGELQIEVEQTQNESILYAKEFQIAEGGEKELHMAVPVHTIQRKFNVYVAVGDEVVYEDVIDVSKFIAPTQPIVGVVSDRPDDYRYLKSVNYVNYYGEPEVMDNYNRYAVTEERKDLGNEPVVFFFDSFEEMSRLDNLEFFNYIYIGDNENLKVNEAFERKLLTWTGKGGTLFVESGEDYKRLYSFLPESITNFEVETVEKVDLPAFSDSYGLTEPLMLVKGEPIESENVRFYAIEEDRLAMYTRKGQGQIINILMDMDRRGSGGFAIKGSDDSGSAEAWCRFQRLPL